jgi:hypothetical protein
LKRRTKVEMKRKRRIGEVGEKRSQKSTWGSKRRRRRRQGRIPEEVGRRWRKSRLSTERRRKKE